MEESQARELPPAGLQARVSRGPVRRQTGPLLSRREVRGLSARKELPEKHQMDRQLQLRVGQPARESLGPERCQTDPRLQLREESPALWVRERRERSLSEWYRLEYQEGEFRQQALLANEEAALCQTDQIAQEQSEEETWDRLVLAEAMEAC